MVGSLRRPAGQEPHGAGAPPLEGDGYRRVPRGGSAGMELIVCVWQYSSKPGSPFPAEPRALEAPEGSVGRS